MPHEMGECVVAHMRVLPGCLHRHCSVHVGACAMIIVIDGWPNGCTTLIAHRAETSRKPESGAQHTQTYNNMWDSEAVRKHTIRCFGLHGTRSSVKRWRSSYTLLLQDTQKDEAPQIELELAWRPWFG